MGKINNNRFKSLHSKYYSVFNNLQKHSINTVSKRIHRILFWRGDSSFLFLISSTIFFIFRFLFLSNKYFIFPYTSTIPTKFPFQLMTLLSIIVSFNVMLTHFSNNNLQLIHCTSSRCSLYHV